MHCRRPRSLVLALMATVPAQDRAPADSVRLKNGLTLEGVITAEQAGYVEIRLPGGLVVGLERARIDHVTRGTAVAEEPRQGALQARDDWFVLHDGDGQVVGRLHATVVVAENGELRVGEEWTFTGRDETTEVTRLEIVDEELAPVSAFYHDRIRGRNDRIVRERVCRAWREGDRWRAELRSAAGPSRKSYPYDATMKLPLFWAEAARQQAPAGGSTALVYDAALAEFVEQTLEAPRRRLVPKGNQVIAVVELTWRTGDARSAEWIDAAARPLRREVAGLALVALPADRAGALQAPSGRTQPGSCVVETGGRFGLWLPNPVWRPGAVAGGRVAIEAPLHAAHALLFELDGGASGAGLESVADTLQRWLLLVHRNLRVTRREPARVRGRSAIVLEASYEPIVDGQAKNHRAIAYVIAGAGHPLALCVTAPAAEIPLLAADIDRIATGVELHGQGIAPRLQGPARR